MIDLYKGDCLEVMDELIARGVVVDAIICDPPYGTTACKWDSVIPFDEMWKRLNKLIKPNGAIVLFGSEPFSSLLRVSNLKMFKYDWIWDKTRGFNFQQSQYMPMRSHEIVSVFSDGKISFNKLGNYMTYNPQKTDTHIKHKSGIPTQSETQHKWNSKPLQKEKQGFLPKTIQTFKKCNSKLHPTQKPVALMEYLIKTYTNENELVLDFTMGSGTTGVACKNLNRRFIGIELDDKYFEIAKNRIENTIAEKSLFE